MFEALKQWYKDECLRKWLKEAYDPMFAFREDLATKGTMQIVSVIDGLEQIIKELRESEGKDDRQIIKDRWTALQFEKALEQYQHVLSKLDELLDNIPKRPDPPKQYDVTFNLFDGFDDY